MCSFEVLFFCIFLFPRFGLPRTYISMYYTLVFSLFMFHTHILHRRGSLVIFLFNPRTKEIPWSEMESIVPFKNSLCCWGFNFIVLHGVPQPRHQHSRLPAQHPLSLEYNLGPHEHTGRGIKHGFFTTWVLRIQRSDVPHISFAG